MCQQGSGQLCIEERLQQVAQQVDLREGLGTFVQRIQKVLENPSFEDKQRILRLVIERIEVGPEEIMVKHSIPLPLYPLRTNDLRRKQTCSPIRTKGRYRRSLGML